MIRVLVVDDEILVRVGIRSLLPWEDHGISIVGEASSGDEAVARLADLDPHVVLTDLVMRHGDGFAVIRAVKRDQPDTAVVVLSCHNEFENVREAMRLGADDYVFKLTLDPRDMLEVFCRLAERRGWPPPRRPDGADGRAVPARVPLESALSQPLDPGERVVVFEADGAGRQDVPLDSLVREALRSRASAASPLRFEDRTGLVISADDQELAKIAADLGALAWRYTSVRVRVGASRASDRPSTREEAAREALRGLAETFYDPDRIGLAGDPLAEARAEPAPLVRGQLQELKSALLTLDVPRLIAAWEVAIAAVRRARERDVKRVRIALLDLLSPLREEVMRRGLDETAIVAADQGVSLHDAVMGSGTLAGIHDAVARGIPHYVAALKSGRTAPRAGIRAAVRYVEENLGRPVTLEEGAAAAGMSVSHFAHTFRREMEDSFMGFVNRAKMERARELLLSSDLRVYEVAEAVGFESANYFSMVFRKLIGTSPAEIKAKHKS